MTITSVALRVGIQCSECMGPVPMNGIVRGVLCHHCGSNVDTRESLEYLALMFGKYWKNPQTWAPDQLKTGYSIFGVRSEATIRQPSCSCGAPFDAADINAALAARMPTTCRSCSQPAATRWADPVVQSVLPTARALIGEVISTDTRAVAHPVMFSCLGCGAGLQVDGSRRVAVCTYCKASNFIPDALWLRMHPAAKRSWFYVAVD